MKISNPDVYCLPISGITACMRSIEHEARAKGEMSMAVYERLQALYEAACDLQEHVVMGKPLPKPDWAV